MKHKLMEIIIFTISIFITVSFTSYAASITAETDSSSKTVTINGSGFDDEDTAVILVESPSKAMDYIDVVEISDGDFKKSYVADNPKPGVYIVHVKSDESEIIKTQFEFKDKEDDDISTEKVPNVTVDYTKEEITIYGVTSSDSSLVTCYVESPDHRIIYIGSAEVIDGQYMIRFAIENPAEGTYYGRIKSDNASETQNFKFVYALKSGLRSCGIEYEQNIPENPPDTAPEINTVHIELVSITQGLYRLWVEKDNPDECIYADNAEPFFFWRASGGTFVDSNSDYTSVIFKVDPNTSGKDIQVVVGMGDGLGQVDYRTFSVAGMNAQW